MNTGEGQRHSDSQDAVLPRQGPTPWLHLLHSGQVTQRTQEGRGCWDAQENESPGPLAGLANTSALNL